MNNECNNILNKIFIVLIVIAVILGLNLVISFISVVNVDDNETTVSEVPNEDTPNNYDVSMFNSVSIGEALALFNSKDTSVLYLGRKTCGACVSFLPTLRTLQNEIGYKTQYLDIEKVDSSSEDYKNFLGKLSKEITQNINGQEQTGKISDFYGYTPMVIIIKNGKAVDASVGAYSEENFRKFLNNNGIK